MSSHDWKLHRKPDTPKKRSRKSWETTTFTDIARTLGAHIDKIIPLPDGTFAAKGTYEGKPFSLSRISGSKNDIRQRITADIATREQAESLSIAKTQATVVSPPSNSSADVINLSLQGFRWAVVVIPPDLRQRGKSFVMTRMVNLDGTPLSGGKIRSDLHDQLARHAPFFSRYYGQTWHVVAGASREKALEVFGIKDAIRDAKPMFARLVPAARVVSRKVRARPVQTPEHK